LLNVLVAGLALGSLYAGVAVTFNVMYLSSKVLGVNAGHIPMACCLIGAWLIGVLGVNPLLGALLSVLAGAALGYLTFEIGVRRLPTDDDQHLWILTTLALATIIQQTAVILWGNEPRPFPRLLAQDYSAGIWDQKFWMPIGAMLAIGALVWLIVNRTMTGKLFVAVSEDPFAAAARGIPVARMRALSFTIAGVFGGIIGFAAGQLTFAYFGLGMSYSLNGFIALAVGGLGSSAGALVGGLTLGLVSAFTTYFFGSAYQQTITVGVLMLILIVKPGGLFGATHARLV
jgi:branched-chain amino acid transport system permease protein